MKRNRIRCTRVYTAHPTTTDVLIKAEKARARRMQAANKAKKEEERLARMAKAEYSEMVMYEKWKNEHGIK